MFAGDLIVQVVGNRLIVRMPEVFGTETLKKGLMAIYEHAQWRDMNELWDFRASIRSDVDFGSMGELIEFMAQHRGERRHEKTAMLFNARAQKGMLRMYQAMASNMPFDVRLFEEEDDAMAWLDECEKEDV